MSRVCCDCGALSPETETPYTLISSKHGWRISFEADHTGKRIPKWRCAGCWTSRKRRRVTEKIRIEEG